MARVLMVSKPIAPPWNDGSKNLVRSLATHLSRHLATVLTYRDCDPELFDVRAETVYSRRQAGFAPPLRDNVTVLSRLLFGEHHPLWHFFFAPNRRSAQAGRLASTLRKVHTLQTVCSAPRARGPAARWLFADITVVLSKHSERLLLDCGCSRTTLRRIAPGVAPLDPPDASERRGIRRLFGLDEERALVIYPGDLEFSSGAERSVRAHARLPNTLDAQLVLACRAKTDRATARERELRELARELGTQERVKFVGETPYIHGLLAVADVVAMPSETLYAKVDYPLVLIEAMSLARPVLVLRNTPAAELAEGGAAIASEHDIEAVAHAMAGLLEQGAERARLGGLARSAASTRFDPARMASEYENLYDELCG